MDTSLIQILRATGLILTVVFHIYHELLLIERYIITKPQFWAVLYWQQKPQNQAKNSDYMYICKLTLEIDI